VGEHPVAGDEEPGTVLAHAAVDRDILGMESLSPGEEHRGRRPGREGRPVGAARREHPAPLGERPAQVDRGRPGGREEGQNRFEAAVEERRLGGLAKIAQAEHQAIRRRHPDRRGTADRQPPDGVGHLLGTLADEPDLLARQAGLIEQLEPQRAPA
jgi:hypothetical protein